jgi:uncharacterized membrane protein YraQ (UPF0718 family)
MVYVFVFTGFVLLLSFFRDSKKTVAALKIALKKLLKILPSFALMLIAVSIALFFVPEQTIVDHLDGSSKWLSFLSALFFGSIAVIPGFIAFPLGGILLGKGVSYMIVSAFTTTLMMVGIVTFPIERVYLGTKVALLRNMISLIITILTALATALFYGELI